MVSLVDSVCGVLVSQLRPLIAFFVLLLFTLFFDGGFCQLFLLRTLSIRLLIMLKTLDTPLVGAPQIFAFI